MRDQDTFYQPYSPETHGTLEDYLLHTHAHRTDPLFFGPMPFTEMRTKGLLVPRSTSIRVNLSPNPDYLYFVSNDFLLESRGSGANNMSCVGAPKGIYTPEEALERRTWSASGLDVRTCK